MNQKWYMAACVACVLGACSNDTGLLESISQKQAVSEEPVTRAEIIPEVWGWMDPASYDYAYIQGVGEIPI